MTKQQQPTLPHIFDALEWQEDCQTIAAAAVRLAERMAADHGQRLRIVKPPEAPRVELRYEGNPYRIGGGMDAPRREPPTLSHARALAPGLWPRKQSNWNGTSAAGSRRPGPLCRRRNKPSCNG